MSLLHRTRIGRSLLVVSQLIAIGWLSPCHCATMETQYRVIALSGQRAPGAPDGVLFEEMILNHDYSPRINDQGAVVFSARLKGDGIDPTNDWAFYLHDGSKLQLLAREGDQAPGQGPGVQYAALSVSQLNISDQQHVSFGAQLTGDGVDDTNDFALYYAQDHRIFPVARTGQLVDAQNPSNSYLTRTFDDVQFDDAGTLYYGVGIANQPMEDFGPSQAIYRYVGRGSRLLWSEQSAAPEPIEAFIEFDVAHDGGLAAHAWLDLPIGSARRDMQILELSSGGATSILREGQEAPGYRSFTEFRQPSIGSPFGNLTHNTQDVTAFTSWLLGDFGPSGIRKSIWLHDPSSREPLRQVLSNTSYLPNHPEHQVVEIFTDTASENVQLSDAGDVAFFAKLRDHESGGDDQWALLVDRGGEIDWVFKHGDAVPGMPEGTTFFKNSFIRHPSFQMNRWGQIAFSTAFRKADGEFGGGMFLAQPDGQITPMILHGELVEVAPGDLREIASVSHFSDISPAGGLASSFNDRGELAMVVRFTDDTTAILVASIPEPNSLRLLSALAILAIPLAIRSKYRPART